MDFGDILNQWENRPKQQKAEKKSAPQVSHKKANAPTKEEKELERLKKESKVSFEDQMKKEAGQKINPMELWLRRYGTIDKDKQLDEYNENKKIEDREYLRTMKCEAYVDLHGLTREEATKKLDSFVLDCARRGLRKIMIIHGKGIHSNGSDPVLGEMVRKYIETDKRLGSSGHPGKAEGGSGATWVIIRQ